MELLKLKTLLLDVNSDSTALNYKISCSNISNSQIKLDNFLIDGKLADKTIFANVSSIDENQNKKLVIRSQITKDKANYQACARSERFLPDE